MSGTELVPYGRLLDGEPNTKTNCIGYALYRLGLAEKDLYRDCPTIGELRRMGLGIAVAGPPQAFAVVYSLNNFLDDSVVNHMAVVSPQDSSLVQQRDGTFDLGCCLVRELTVEDFMVRYGQWGAVISLRVARLRRFDLKVVSKASFFLHFC